MDDFYNEARMQDVRSAVYPTASGEDIRRIAMVHDHNRITTNAFMVYKTRNVLGASKIADSKARASIWLATEIKD